MWYETIPPFAIMVVAMAMPQVFTYYVHKLTQNGNPYRRDLLPIYNRNLYFRDMRLTGNVYKQNGLDNISDK